MKSRNREIGCYNDCIALKYDRHLGSAAAEVLGKIHCDSKCLNMNRDFMVSRLHEILRSGVRPLSE